VGEQLPMDCELCLEPGTDAQKDPVAAVDGDPGPADADLVELPAIKTQVLWERSFGQGKLVSCVTSPLR